VAKSLAEASGADARGLDAADDEVEELSEPSSLPAPVAA
jgi:hypothetical protein